MIRSHRLDICPEGTLNSEIKPTKYKKKKTITTESLLENNAEIATKLIHKVTTTEMMPCWTNLF